MKNWLLYTSTDMVNWTDHGIVASLKDFNWTDPENGAWAPQVIERNGKFYMYCPMPGQRGIGVLVADSPYGPFKDPIGKPLVKNSSDDIDPTVFIDDDGQAYLYWGNPNLWYVKLNEDMISVNGEVTKDASIAKVKGSPDPFHYQEGPWVWKKKRELLSGLCIYLLSRRNRLCNGKIRNRTLGIQRNDYGQRQTF